MEYRMRKKFNITGSCNPERHYMVNSKARFEAVEDLIGAGEYFTINRARQYGKTTTLYMIWRQLSDRYTVVPLSLEGIGDRGRFRMQVNYAPGGRLDMEQVITRFAELMHQEYRESTVPFLEKEGRLLFLTFLKPIINGTGFYYVEPQTRDNRRMDLVVAYGSEEFIIELKIWRGEKYEEQGRDQLASYLATRGTAEGYLVTFDFSRRRKAAEPRWIEHNGKRIFEVTI